MLEVGKKAPAFTLLNQDGEKVKLSDFRGQKVVLFAYPKAATSGCTKQAVGFAEHYKALAKAGAVVLGISPDPVEKLKKWKQSKDFPFDLLSDPDHKILQKYGAWGMKKLYGRSYEGVIRSHWIIGPDGKVLDAQVKVSPQASVTLATEFCGI
jgi:peroxiredoxin Q/BCP